MIAPASRSLDHDSVGPATKQAQEWFLHSKDCYAEHGPIVVVHVQVVSAPQAARYEYIEANF